MLNPEDLKKKTFTKGFRGYEVEEVDKFLAKLCPDRGPNRSCSSPRQNGIRRYGTPPSSICSWRAGNT